MESIPDRLEISVNFRLARFRYRLSLLTAEGKTLVEHQWRLVLGKSPGAFLQTVVVHHGLMPEWASGIRIDVT